MASLATKPVEGEEDPQVHPSLHQQFDDHPGLHLSRLSMCTKGETITHIDDEYYDGDDDYDKDDDKEEDGRANSTTAYNVGISPSGGGSSMTCHSDNKEAPTAPRWRWRWRRRMRGDLKEYYASDNETQQKKGKEIVRRRGRGTVGERWVERSAGRVTIRYSDDDDYDSNNLVNNRSGESECLVITRPKGGRRSLCMDLKEVKACRELGFELDRISLSMSPTYSTIDYTSSGGNSPIASWRISSPGDDPRDVKARLKTWAQMVALATATR